MNIYKEKQALPFSVYQKFIEKVRNSDRGIYDFLGELGFLVKTEKEYKNLILNVELINNPSKEYWDSTEKYSYVLAGKIDTFCSRLKFVAESLVKNGIIVDIGCGDRILSEWMRRNTNAEVIGIDYSRNMLKDYGKFKPQVARALGDCEELPIKNGAVNQVFLVGFASAANMKKMLEESNRMLASGGEVRIVEICSVQEPYLPLPKSYIPYMKKFKDYDEFVKKFMDIFYENQRTQNELFGTVETFEFISESILEKEAILQGLGLDWKYEFPRIPVLPRGFPNKHFFNFPYAIVGKKSGV